MNDSVAAEQKISIKRWPPISGLNFFLIIKKKSVVLLRSGIVIGTKLHFVIKFRQNFLPFHCGECCFISQILRYTVFFVYMRNASCTVCFSMLITESIKQRVGYDVFIIGFGFIYLLIWLSILWIFFEFKIFLFHENDNKNKRH